MTTTNSSALSRFLVEGKSALVTGGGDGIGRATCLLLAEAGARVAVLDRDGERAAAVAGEITANGGAARAYGADVTDEAALVAAITDCAARQDGLDILVNNAGIAIRGPAVSMDVADWNRVLAVNMTGMFVAARTAAALMHKGRGGAVVNTASIMGLSGGLYPNVAYQASKGGVVNLTRALAVEWAPVGIRVNAVAPTYVRTRLVEKLVSDPAVMARITEATPLARLAEPDEVAAAILFLASPAASMITGAILPVDGGFLTR